MSYLNVSEAESALFQLSSNFPQYCQIIRLPHQTHEKRRCTALKITYSGFFDTFPFLFWWLGWLFRLFADFFSSLSGNKKTIVFIGGQHAREWVPTDALVFFCQQAIRCLYQNTPIDLGGYSITRKQLTDILSRINIVVFPQVNPDGRNNSMTANVMWRKNLRPNDDPQKMGVDLNRNYDFLWDFPQHFSSEAQVASSINEIDETYIGPSPLSEPETKNVQWLVQSQKATHFIDVHSYSEYILYNWADDQSQHNDPGMSFKENSFSSLRGIKEDTAYREYMPAADADINRSLADDMAAAISSIRNHQYTVKEWVDMYPASGTSTDYMQSLFFSAKSTAKIHAFCIECGKDTFQPDLDERGWIIKEVNAALFQFAKSTAF